MSPKTMGEAPRAPRMPPGPAAAAAGLAALLRPQARMFEAVLTENLAVLEFLKARIEKDREMMARLATIEDASAAAALWSDFWQRMMGDYSVEADKLAGASASIAEEALKMASEEGKALETALTPRRGEMKGAEG